MPIFHAHIPAQKFSSEEKRALADALNLALHEAMDTPMNDRFVIISEHKDDEFFIHPTFPDMKRSDKRMIVTVTSGTSRTVEQKRKLAELVTRCSRKGWRQPGRYHHDDVCHSLGEHELRRWKAGL